MGFILAVAAWRGWDRAGSITRERQIGTLLPCNVVVRTGETGVIVDAMDPAIMASVTGNPQLKPIADEAARLVGGALSELGAAGIS
jgi:uncharacterized protein (DUF302 family)